MSNEKNCESRQRISLNSISIHFRNVLIILFLIFTPFLTFQTSEKKKFFIENFLNLHFFSILSSCTDPLKLFKMDQVKMYNQCDCWIFFKVQRILFVSQCDEYILKYPNCWQYVLPTTRNNVLTKIQLMKKVKTIKQSAYRHQIFELNAKALPKVRHLNESILSTKWCKQRHFHHRDRLRKASIHLSVHCARALNISG